MEEAQLGTDAAAIDAVVLALGNPDSGPDSEESWRYVEGLLVTWNGVEDRLDLHLAEVVHGRAAEQQNSQLQNTVVEGLGAVESAGGEAEVVHYRISTCGCLVRIQETALRSCTGLTVGVYLMEEGAMEGRHFEVIADGVSEVEVVDAHSKRRAIVRSSEVLRRALVAVEAPEEALVRPVAGPKEVVDQRLVQ